MPEEWRQSAPFIHFFSYWLERYAILPLTLLARISKEDASGDSELVSFGLVEALAYAWATVQAAYLSSSTPTQAEAMKPELPQHSVLHRVDGELDALRKAVTAGPSMAQ